MISFFRFLLDLLYPAKCGLCGEIGTEAICSDCSKYFTMFTSERELEGISDVIVLFEYQTRPAQAVQRLKYDRITSLVDNLADYIARRWKNLPGHEQYLVIPVPIHWTRRFHRGFNQSELLCSAIPQQHIDAQALKRVRATRPQVGLSSEERSRNLTGAFQASEKVKGRHILLVDDVLTTGNTAMECAKALKEAGAQSVSALFLTGESLQQRT